MNANSSRRTLACGLALALGAHVAGAQSNNARPDALWRNRFRNGDETLHAFAPVSAATRHSIVKLNVDGETVALGTVVDTHGLVLTKASELKPGKLTCWLAGGTEVPAQLVGADDEEDVALVRVSARGLRPVVWATNALALGQWAITPGIEEAPHAVGIVSALPRRIGPQRAFMGVQFDLEGDAPKIALLLPGLGAEKAGLKEGDVILAVNGTAMTNRAQVVETLRNFRDGQTVRLRLERADAQLNADVRMTVPKADASGRGFFFQQRPEMLSGQVSLRAEGFDQVIQHDTVLQPWLCGGPLVNLAGQAIGINIARAGRVATYALPSALVQHLLEGLKAKARAPAPKRAPAGAKSQ
jgi:serine protease Do